tara:strand:+ start:128631 stop:129437 length:807 start_codon:yes stop_codon:yes gene_type:complete
MKFNLKLIEDLKTIVIDSLPKILGVIAFIIISWILIKLILMVVKRILKFSRIELINSKINENELFNSVNITIDLNKILLNFLKWFLVLVVIILGADLFNLEKISIEVGKLINFLPTIFSAMLILFVGIYLASYAKNALKKILSSFDVGGAQAISSIAFYICLIITTIITLNHLGVNTDIITNNLTIILGAALAAFTLALGLGSRDVVQRLLFGFYSRKNLEVGQRIKIGEIEGTIVSIDNICLILHCENQKIIYPIKKIVNKKIEILE